MTLADQTFTAMTTQTAPPGSASSMTAVASKLGFVSAPVARLAASPAALTGFLRINAIFESCSLAPMEREVLIMTVATRNGCHYCVAMHTRTLTSAGADDALVAALRERRRPSDPRLAAVADFTTAVMDHTGEVPEAELKLFLDNGFTAQQALDVVLGIATYTLSTFANRLTAAPLDESLEQFRW